jgi:hypothetical protein
MDAGWMWVLDLDSPPHLAEGSAKGAKRAGS